MMFAQQRKQLSLSLVLALTFIGGLTAADLNIKISVVNLAENVRVNVQYTNTGKNVRNLYQRYVRADNCELSSPIFAIAHKSGKSVRYVGHLEKLTPEANGATVSLATGQSVNFTVCLSPSYDLRKSDLYTITFKLLAGQLIQGETFTQTLTSNTVKVYIEGHPNSIIQETERLLTEQSKATATTEDLVIANNCNQKERNKIFKAIRQAKQYARESTSFFKKRSVSSGVKNARFVTWFGNGTSAAAQSQNYQRLSLYFTAIQTALEGEPHIYDCACVKDPSKQDTYARVLPDRPYIYYLCAAFFTAQFSGFSTPGGTLIHETSHYGNVVGTKDIVYGEESCQKLARTCPNCALANADSIEYFAESAYVK